MWFILILIGVLSGVLGSMGLGGGTILIPLLSLIQISQKSAQVINIFSFVVVAFFIIFFYVKKGFIQVFPALCFSILGVLSASFTALLVQETSSHTIKILFGIFLLSMALFELFNFLTKYVQK